MSDWINLGYQRGKILTLELGSHWLPLNVNHVCRVVGIGNFVVAQMGMDGASAVGKNNRREARNGGANLDYGRS